MTQARGESAWSASQRKTLRSRLLRWYAAFRRDLPWRRDRNPYFVWVSEVMLQQTQVATVGPYFQRFIDAFPTVEALAAADEEHVLRLWEGLGYYRRARGLHAAARVLVAEHGGRLPRDVEQLRKLPGIGRYTAGAIASIAFELPAPILEANSIRVLARLLAFDGDVSSAAGQRVLWAAAEELVPRTAPGEFNQALMELGSLVCRVADPHCRECPAKTVCRAAALGRASELPRPKAPAARERVQQSVVVVRKASRILLLRSPEGGRWAGMWDFARLENDGRPLDVSGEIERLTGYQIGSPTELGRLEHGVTRFQITLDCLLADWTGGRKRRDLDARWMTFAQAAEAPMSVTGRQITELARQATRPR